MLVISECMYWESILGCESLFHTSMLSWSHSHPRTSSIPQNVHFLTFIWGFVRSLVPVFRCIPVFGVISHFHCWTRCTVPAENMDYSHWQILQPIGGHHRSESYNVIGRSAAGGGAKAAFNPCLCLRSFVSCAGYCTAVSLYALYFILFDKTSLVSLTQI